MPCLPEDLAAQAVAHLRDLPGPRKLIALAGPPGAGKSTLAACIRDQLLALGRSAEVVPMDGFHLDNRVLAARGLLARKGAPETFDSHGFRHLVLRIAAGEEGVVYPVFDRSRDIAIAGAGVLKAETEFVLFEGNYLLSRDAPWSDLAPVWSFRIRLEEPIDRLEARLMARWAAVGLSEGEARARVQSNDLPNIRYVQSRASEADLTLAIDGTA
jgi:pantothenate kinase